MRAVVKRTRSENRRTRFASIVVALVAVAAIAYLVGWGAVVYVESASDYTCILLYEDAGLEDRWASASTPGRTYFPNPGYTCRYLVDGEWITLREDLTQVPTSALAISVVVTTVTAAGIWIYSRTHQDSDSPTLDRSQVR